MCRRLPGQKSPGFSGFTERNGTGLVRFLLFRGPSSRLGFIHHHMLTRKLPAFCSLLLLAGPVANGLAQGPLLPPMARNASLGQVAQAAPAATATPALIPTTPTTPVNPAETTPAPLTDPNVPAPIAPPTLNGTPAAPGAPGVVPAPPVDTASPAGNANSGGARAREFQGDDVGQVLRLLARQAKINLIVSPQVTGTINMRLEDVTALQAIEVICQAQGYDITQNKGVYYVKTPAEKAAEPTQSDFYTFSYARAAQIVPLLTSQLKSKAAAPAVDERTNTVFYQEAKSNVSVIREFLAQVDKPTRQVMIEARLVEVNSNPVQSYGINWAGVVGSAGSPKTFRYGGSTLQTQAASTVDPTTGQQIPGAITNPSAPVGSDGSLISQDFLRGAINRPGISGAVDSALSGQIAILDIPSFSATVRFLNEDSDAEFLATPRIVTADNLEATIKIVRNQPVPQLNFNEQTATAVFGGFQDKIYGSTLTVKPSINKDNFITMSVKPEISNRIGDQVFNFAGAQVSSPIIDTRTLEANVLIKSGCTLAIGGLLQDQVTKGTTKVPILGDIPILGYLFQEHLNVRNKRDLLIFVTPTIISQKYGTGLESQGSRISTPARTWRTSTAGVTTPRVRSTSRSRRTNNWPESTLLPRTATRPFPSRTRRRGAETTERNRSQGCQPARSSGSQAPDCELPFLAPRRGNPRLRAPEKLRD